MQVDAAGWALATGALHALAAYSGRVASKTRPPLLASRSPVNGLRLSPSAVGARRYGLLREVWAVRAGGRDAPSDADDAALERFLMRRTGAVATDARRVRKRGDWASFEAGATLCDTDRSREFLFLVLSGVVRISWRDDAGDEARSSTVASRAAAKAGVGTPRRRRGRFVDGFDGYGSQRQNTDGSWTAVATNRDVCGPPR